jgi:hypothetical protein
MWRRRTHLLLLLLPRIPVLLLLLLLLRRGGCMKRGLKPLQQLGRRKAHLLSRRALGKAASLGPLLLCSSHVRVRAAGCSRGLSDCRLQGSYNLWHPRGACKCGAQVTGLRDGNQSKGVQDMRTQSIYWAAELSSTEVVDQGALKQTAQRLCGTGNQIWAPCRQQVQRAR